MSDSAILAFQRLKPLCVSLSAVSLREPSASSPALRKLYRELQHTDRCHITQSFGNYIFFPLKPLLAPDIHESLRCDVFEIISWLLQTQWFVRGGEMTTQLVILFTTLIAKAKSEELKITIYAALKTLFAIAGREVDSLACRPTLAHLTTLSLSENTSIETTTTALEALLVLYENLGNDAAASFLPGTVSSLTKSILKQNQKSAVIIRSISTLRVCIVKSFDGISSDYRTGAWYAATESQLLLALTPVLLSLAENDNPVVEKEMVRLCQTMLASSTISHGIFLEFLLRTNPLSIAEKHKSSVAEVLEGYVDAMVRILHGTSEAAKLQMLKMMIRALPFLPSASLQVLSQRILTQVCSFVRFSVQQQMISSVDTKDDTVPPVEPSIMYVSSEVQKVLGELLASCKFSEEIVPSSLETLWIAQKSGFSSPSYAMQHLFDSTDLCLMSIISEARALGRAYRSQLLHVLYPLLTLPRPNYYTLNVISESCQYSSVQDMLIDNADYVINQLQLAFITLDLTPRTPRILGLLVELAPKMIELIDDVVATFFEALDDYHAYQALVNGIFIGLESVVVAASRLQPCSSLQSAFKILSAREQDKSFEERFEEASDITEHDRRKLPENDQERQSRSYTMVLQIMEKAQLFLSHEDHYIRIRVLEMLHKGVPVVALDEDKFLPLIHTYWPQLTRRLEDPNPFVVAAVLRLMAQTVTFAGSFMRMRILDDVLPAARQILQPQTNKRGNVVGPRTAWEGTGRRKVANGLEDVLHAAQDNGGLVEEEQHLVLSLVSQLTGHHSLS